MSQAPPALPEKHNEMEGVMGAVFGLDGLLLVGTFKELRPSRDGGMAAVVVTCNAFDGSTFDRSALFWPVDQETGEVNRIGEAAQELTIGSPVAVRCKLSVSRRSGKAYLQAFGAVELDQADDGAPILAAVA